MPTTDSALTGDWTQKARGTTLRLAARGTPLEWRVNESATAPATTDIGEYLAKNTGRNFNLTADERLWVRSVRTVRGRVVITT